MKRRRMCVLVVVAALAVVASAYTSSGPAAASSGKTFTFAGFGGALQDSQVKAWFNPFDAAKGAKALQTSNTSLAALQTQIQSGNVQWDVVEDSQFQGDSGCGTLYQKIPSVNRSQINPKFITNKCGVPIVAFSFVLAYNSKDFSTAPTSVGDLVDTHDFPGKRGISDQAQNGVLEAALLGSGVSKAHLYPLNYNKAIAKLGTIKSDLVINDSFATLENDLVSGDVSMALIPNGRAYDASKLDPNIKVAWGGAVTLYDNALIVKGAPHTAIAKSFLSYVAKAKTQAALAKVLPYGVLTSGTPPTLSAAMEPFYPNSPGNASKLLYQNQTWWGHNQDVVNQAWTNFISS